MTKRYAEVMEMVDDIIGSSSRIELEEEEQAAAAAPQSIRDVPAIHVSGGHVVLAIYGDIGQVTIYRQADDDPMVRSHPTPL